MIPVSRPLILKKSKTRLMKALSKTSIAQGNEIKEFENKIGNYLNKKFAVSTTSGTTALYLALKCLNLKKLKNTYSKFSNSLNLKCSFRKLLQTSFL